MNKPLILVVEDNAVLQKLLRLMSTRCGVEADVVSNGSQALAALGTGKPYQLVLMDWRMPDMDGLECTKRIREKERLSGGHLPIIAMTANADDQDRETCFSVGMDDYLAKPFSNEQLQSAIVRWIEPQSMAI